MCVFVVLIRVNTKKHGVQQIIYSCFATISNETHTTANNALFYAEIASLNTILNVNMCLCELFLLLVYLISPNGTTSNVRWCPIAHAYSLLPVYTLHLTFSIQCEFVRMASIPISYTKANRSDTNRTEAFHSSLLSNTIQRV